jgi:diaminopimelate epimerase
MEIDFLKMQGCGEDAVLMDCFKQPKPKEASLQRLARRMLDRRCGIGADSLLLLAGGNGCRLAVRCLDAEGDEVPASGNALRCAARYASDSGICVEERFPIQISSGSVPVQIIDSANVRMDMGMPARARGAGELREKPLESFTQTLVVGDRQVTYTPVSLDASYGVIFVTVFDFPIPRTARSIVSSLEFPDETGVCFTQVFNREELRLRVWEIGRARGKNKGVEGPASCGGAASAVVASVVNGFTDREVFVHCAGGDFFVQWAERDNKLYLTGPAAYVFTGMYYFEEESG